MPQRLATYFGRMLEAMLLTLMVTLTSIVIVAVIYRKGLNNSLSWYDEVAEIMLIWVTYFGSALAALRRKHIGFDGFLLSLPLGARVIAYVISEIIVIGFFVILTYGGWIVFKVVQGDSLVSLTWVPQQLPQSIIPIGGALFIIAELMSVPQAWKSVRAGVSLEHEDIEHEIKLAKEALKK
ncbi:MAG: TRAP transporter small permease [Pseudomonadota bacterium]|nr:TRAP transporter small permease [Pseudomonadota bacterium]